MPERERSEELQEILGRMPSWPVRWGSIAILGLMAALLIYAWKVRSPELIRGEAVVMGKRPPAKVRAERSGIIGKLWEDGGVVVEAGERIFFIGKRERMRSVKALLEEARKAKRSLRMGERPPPFPSRKVKEESLQGAVQKVKSSFSDYERASEREEELRGSDEREKRIRYARHRLEIQKERKELLKVETAQAEEALRTKRELMEEGAATRKEMREAKRRLLQKEKERKAVERRCFLARSQLSELREGAERSKKEMREEKRKAKEDLSLALENFQRRAEAWLSKRTVKAPIGGELNKLLPVKEGRWIEKGKAPFVIVPRSDGYRARGSFPEKGFGKVEKGMEVLLELPEYPRSEYGVLKGRVENASPLSVDGEYQVDIRLENGLRTNFGRKVEVEGRTSAEAALKTKEKKLLERIFTP